MRWPSTVWLTILCGGKLMIVVSKARKSLIRGVTKERDYCTVSKYYVAWLQSTVDVKAEDQDEAEPSIEELLASLGLSDYLEAFNKEQIDMETLVNAAIFKHYSHLPKLWHDV